MNEIKINIDDYLTEQGVRNLAIAAIAKATGATHE